MNSVNLINSILYWFILNINGELKGIPDATWPTLNNQPVQLFGHRGMKSQQPEHTTGSYWLAAINGDDYIEPDLVLTKDGIPVCYHNLFLLEGTDINNRVEFNDRRRNFTDIIDGKLTIMKNAFVISDFTLLELRRLRVIQPVIGVRPLFFNGIFKIPTFQEFIDLIHLASHKLNKTINIVPELKNPVYHNKIHGSRYFENTVIEILKVNGYPISEQDKGNCQSNLYSIPCGEVILQSFNPDTLIYLRKQSHHIKLMRLANFNPIDFTYEGLKEIAQYADWFGPWKEYIKVGPEIELTALRVTWNQSEINERGGFIPGNKIISFAHQHKLKVVLYTFYDSRERSYRNCAIKCDPEDIRSELRDYFLLGVDGLFVENVNEAIQIRLEFHTELRLNATYYRLLNSLPTIQ